jgi:hypothetical protein
MSILFQPMSYAPLMTIWHSVVVYTIFFSVTPENVIHSMAYSKFSTDIMTYSYFSLVLWNRLNYLSIYSANYSPLFLSNWILRVYFSGVKMGWIEWLTSLLELSGWPTCLDALKYYDELSGGHGLILKRIYIEVLWWIEWWPTIEVCEEVMVECRCPGYRF